MKLATVRPGDIVQCDVRGQRFLAFVEDRNGQSLEVRTTRLEQFQRVTSRQVIGHWRRAGKRKAQTA